MTESDVIPHVVGRLSRRTQAATMAQNDERNSVGIRQRIRKSPVDQLAALSSGCLAGRRPAPFEDAQQATFQVQSLSRRQMGSAGVFVSAQRRSGIRSVTISRSPE